MWFLYVKPSLESVFRSGKLMIAVCSFLEFFGLLATNIVVSHQALYALVIYVKTSLLQLPRDSFDSVGVMAFFHYVSDLYKKNSI